MGRKQMRNLRVNEKHLTNYGQASFNTNTSPLIVKSPCMLAMAMNRILPNGANISLTANEHKNTYEVSLKLLHLVITTTTKQFPIKATMMITNITTAVTIRSVS